MIVQESDDTGATHVTVTIRDPAELPRTWEGLFLADTGATDSFVPSRQHGGHRPRPQRPAGL